MPIIPLLKLHLFSAGCWGGGNSIVRGAEWEGVREVRWAGGGRDGEWWELSTSKTACFKREPTSLRSSSVVATLQHLLRPGFAC